MAITFHSGCLLDAFDKGEVDVIVHCVNCKGVMGSGIARSIKERYPLVFKCYTQFIEENKENYHRLLGSIQNVELHNKGVIGKWQTPTVVNVFGQDNFGTSKRQLNYGAIGKAFTAMSCGLEQADEFAISDGYVIGFPYGFGCGLAGGDWSIVLEMIEFHFKGYDVRIYKI